MLRTKTAVRTRNLQLSIINCPLRKGRPKAAPNNADPTPVSFPWLLEYNEQEQAFRSMELKIKTRNTDRSQELLRKIFQKNKLDAEVRQLDPPDAENPI